MGSVVRRMRRRKRCLGEVRVLQPGRGSRGDALNTHTSPARPVRAARQLVQDHELHRVGEHIDRGALRQDRLLEDFEPAASLAGDGAARHRTTVATGEGASPPSEPGGRAASRTQYQTTAEPDGRGRVIKRWSRVDFQLKKGLTRALEAAPHAPGSHNDARLASVAKADLFVSFMFDGRLTAVHELHLSP